MAGEDELIDREKDAAARAAAGLIEPGMVVGLGSGTTSEIAVRYVGERVRGGLVIVAVATSRKTARLAAAEGIPLITEAVPLAIDLTIDGADEFDASLRLIKGGGGDLLFEKIVASASRREVIMADHHKKVDVLGSTFPLAVEVIPFASPLVAETIRGLGGKPAVRPSRKGDAGSPPFVTDSGHHILDCDFGPIADPETLAAALDGISGVVEHGLFLGMASEVIMAVGDRIEVFKAP